MADKRYFTYEVKGSSGDYVMVKTGDNKIITFTNKETLIDFTKTERTNGLLRILDITEDIKSGNIPLSRIEILE